MTFERSSGVFCHVTSLPSPHGIGDLGAGARTFLDFLDRAGVDHWQTCPLGPTIAAAGESPYQSYSAFAGNPLLISLEQLVEEDALRAEELEPVPEFPADRVDYEAVREYKLPLLETAFERFDAHATGEAREAFERFREEESWLDDYTLFRELSAARPEDTWVEWPAPLREREPEALAEAREEHAERIRYHAFRQWTFDRQWEALREEAAERDVSMVGDVPIYVSLDSADVWANPDAFQLGEDHRPTAVAGVPPNPGDDGQRWGNPLYDWETLAANDYDWWLDRFRRLFDQADAARLDHFLGFIRYWAIPADADDPAAGEWRDGPGRELFERVRAAFGEVPFLAEDLGFVDDRMRELQIEYELPGMRVPHYADWCAEGNDHQPMHYPENSAGYTSTHDTDTFVSYYEGLPAEQRDCLHYNLGIDGERAIEWEIIDAVWGSEAVVAFTTVQDLLGLGSEARFNEPGTASGNWEWRVREDALTEELADRLWELGEFHVR